LSDLAAGVTVGVVALPLAIGFAIASGVEPSRGLWTAIIAGFVISALGGSLVQVGGPTGAFVPILFAIVAKYGYDGLVVATIMAGVMLVAMGALKLGNLIKFIPYPVTSGFTSGIAVIIFVGQLKEFLGLTVKMPAHTPEQVAAITQNLAQTRWPALGLGLLALAILILCQSVAPRASLDCGGRRDNSAGGGLSNRRPNHRLEVRRYPARPPEYFLPETQLLECRNDDSGVDDHDAGRD